MEEKLEQNIRTMLKSQLALENYCDNVGETIPSISNVFKKQKEFRSIRSKFEIKELIDISNNIIKDFNNVFDEIGREKFVFYDDGDINYIWKKGEKNE